MRKEDDFSKGKRGAVIPPDRRKTRITIRLDTKILKWFWQRVDEAGGGNYQTMINEALKSYIESNDSRTIRYSGVPARRPDIDGEIQTYQEAEGLKFKGRGYDFLENVRDLDFTRKKAA